MAMDEIIKQHIAIARTYITTLDSQIHDIKLKCFDIEAEIDKISHGAINYENKYVEIKKTCMEQTRKDFLFNLHQKIIKQNKKIDNAIEETGHNEKQLEIFARFLECITSKDDILSLEIEINRLMKIFDEALDLKNINLIFYPMIYNDNLLKLVLDKSILKYFNFKNSYMMTDGGFSYYCTVEKYNVATIIDNLASTTRKLFLRFGSWYHSSVLILPNKFYSLTNLQYLDLDHCNLTKISPDISIFVNLKFLSLRTNRLTELPHEFGNLVNLEKLRLEQNYINVLPPEFGNLVKLTKLCMRHNTLEIIPSEIFKLTNLQYLDLSVNKLEVIPTEIFKLTTLQHLGLSENKLRVIPTEIGKFTHLKVLDLSQNLLKNIPSEISELGNLNGLYVSTNKLRNIPIEIYNLKNLEILDIKYNKISKLPIEILNTGINIEKLLSIAILHTDDSYIYFAYKLPAASGIIKYLVLTTNWYGWDTTDCLTKIKFDKTFATYDI